MTTLESASADLLNNLGELAEDRDAVLIQHGTFSRDWADEEALDELMNRADSGAISVKQALLHAQKLLAKSPD